jgi:hypothetical protein
MTQPLTLRFERLLPVIAEQDVDADINGSQLSFGEF